MTITKSDFKRFTIRPSVARMICVVAIVRDELPFIDEWLAYHRLLGVEHFFLYDDDPALPLKDFVTPHKAYVTVIDWFGKSDRLPGRNRQTKAYMDAISRVLLRYRWVAFLDIDEFVVLRRHADILSFLVDYDDCPAVSLHWREFGHNGFFDDPSDLVTASLTRRMAASGRMWKSFTQPSAVVDIDSAHFCRLKRGYRRVDVNKNPFVDTTYPGKDEVAHINHYLCRSFTRWMKRVERGCFSGDEGKIPLDKNWKTNRDECLRYFVREIAMNRNEHVDDHLARYRQSILDYLHSIGVSSPRIPLAVGSP